MKPGAAANKPDGDLLEVTSLEQASAPFKMTGLMLVGGTLSPVTFLCPRWTVTEILEH